MSDLSALLDELAVAPNMPAARCAGRHELYDATIEATRMGKTAAAALAAARVEALRLCSGCPELARCAEWVDSLPPRQRPRGVVAGRLVDDRGRAVSGRATARGRPPDTPSGVGRPRKTRPLVHPAPPMELLSRPIARCATIERNCNT